MTTPIGALLSGASGGHDLVVAVGRRLVVAAGDNHRPWWQAGDLCDRERALHRTVSSTAKPYNLPSRKDPIPRPWQAASHRCPSSTDRHPPGMAAKRLH